MAFLTALFFPQNSKWQETKTRDISDIIPHIFLSSITHFEGSGVGQDHMSALGMDIKSYLPCSEGFAKIESPHKQIFPMSGDVMKTSNDILVFDKEAFLMHYRFLSYMRNIYWKNK